MQTGYPVTENMLTCMHTLIKVLIDTVAVHPSDREKVTAHVLNTITHTVPSEGILEIISDADWSLDFVMANSCCSLFTSDTSCSARAGNRVILKR